MGQPGATTARLCCTIALDLESLPERQQNGFSESANKLDLEPASGVRT